MFAGVEGCVKPCSYMFKSRVLRGVLEVLHDECHIGSFKWEAWPKMRGFSLVHAGQTCTTIASVWTVSSPRNAMPSNRPNLTRPPLTQPDLTLDEESFQELLSAAFTIQEHNDRRKGSLPKDELPKEPEVGHAPEAHILCPHCGSSKRAGESRCPQCNLDELRPGERMQRNWASMWLMSQEQGLWPERSGTFREDEVGEKQEETRRNVPSRERQLSTGRSASDSASSGFLSQRPGTGEEFLLEEPGITAEETNDAMPESTLGGVPESEDAIDHSHLNQSHLDHSHLLNRLSELRIILRFHRADFYLGAAVCVAALALLWPAATLPRHHGLGLWDRTLVALGVAEAPAPTVRHFQGDPAVEVWVDPHTALYYCPGEEQYGKTADGRRSSQRDAQMERFEPAGRTACE
jgi:hypothetical protein